MSFDFNFNSIGPIIAAFAVFGTGFGVLVRGWASIKAFFINIWRYIIVEVVIDGDKAGQSVLAYIINKYKRSRINQKTFGGKFDSFRNGKYGLIPYEFFGKDKLLFWNGWFPIWFSIVVEKSESKEVTFSWSAPEKTVKQSVYYIRWTLNIENIIKEACQERNNLYWISSTHRRFFIKKVPDATGGHFNSRMTAGTNLAWYYEGIYRLLAHKPEELGVASNSKGKVLDSLYFSDSVNLLIDEIKMWTKLRDWYVDRNIPWKRGWVLYGPPGTGKSALVRAIAEDLDMPLFVYSLGVMMNEDLERSWSDMQSHVPCIALFEDFDNVFHGRENIYGRANLQDMLENNKMGVAKGTETIANAGKLSFDCLLNCIDGVSKTNGIFTVVTTNHIDKLDAAFGTVNDKKEFISTRPGRIDKAIYLGHMANEDKKKLAKRIFYDNEEGYRLMCEIIDQNPDKLETPAQFQELCTAFAIKLLWNREKVQSNGHRKVKIHEYV